MKKINKIVLAYSGGLDTSAMLLWLKETYGCEVVCYCADVGQGEELAGLEEKALKSGASKLYVEDLREEFVEEYVWPALEPDIKVVAPWREWEFKGRSDLIAYAKEHDIPVTATAEKPYSTDRNLMHVSYEGGILEDPWAEPPADIFQMTAAPESARAEAQYVVIGFERGVPV